MLKKGVDDHQKAPLSALQSTADVRSKLSLLKEDKVKTILVMVSDPSSGKVTIHRALQFVLDSLNEGHFVEMYLCGKAVLVTQKGHETAELSAVFDESIQNCKELMKLAIARGAKVKVCETCANGHSLSQNQLYEGAAISTPKDSMKDLIRWRKECDKIVSFNGDSFECKTKEEIENKEG